MAEVEFCPGCGADLRGELIYDTFISQGASPEKAHHDCTEYYGDPDHTKRFGKAWLLEDPAIYDGAAAYGCPECKHVWRRLEWITDAQLETIQKDWVSFENKY